MRRLDTRRCVLRPAWVDAQPLLPDLAPAITLHLDSAEATCQAVDGDHDLGMRTQVVVPGRMAVLPEVGGDHRKPVRSRQPDDGHRPLAAAARSGRRQHHDRQPGEQTRERVPAACQLIDGRIDPVQRAREHPRPRPARRDPPQALLEEVGAAVWHGRDRGSAIGRSFRRHLAASSPGLALASPLVKPLGRRSRVGWVKSRGVAPARTAAQARCAGAPPRGRSRRGHPARAGS